MNFIILTGINSKFFQRGLGAYQLAHHLRIHGYTCQVIDFLHAFTNDELVNTIEKFITKDTLGIGISTTFFNKTKKPKSRSVKAFSPGLPDNINYALEYLGNKYPNIKRIAGGGFASLLTNSPLIDIIIDGYAEDSMLEVANQLQQNAPVNRINEKLNKEFDITTLDHRFTDNDCILPGETLPIEISRGCIFRCKFCAYPLNGKKKLDYIRDPKCVANEMRYNYEKYQITNYIFTDDTFNDSTEKLVNLYEEIKKLPFKINFYCYLRIDLLYAHPEQIDLLKKMGLRACNFGIETFHPVAAKAIGKGMPADKIKEFLLELHYKHWGKDINPVCSMIIGLPGEPKEHILDSMKWFQESPITAVFFPLTFQSEYKWKSEFVLNPQRYGYQFDKNGQWFSDQMHQKDAINMHFRRLLEMSHSNSRIDPFATLAAMTQYSTADALSLTWKQLEDESEKIEKHKQDLIIEYKQRLGKL